jgi:hypothetical protein
VRSPAEEAAGALVLVWSLWVGFNGLVYGTYGLEACTASHYAQEFLCWYVPEFSPLFRAFIDPKPLNGSERALLAYLAAVALAVLVPRARQLASARVGSPSLSRARRGPISPA